MEPRYIIFVETVAGEIIKAFTWCRDEMSGIARAKRDAKDFNITPIRVWAEKIEVQ